MRFVTYLRDGAQAVGLLDTDDRVHDLTGVVGSAELTDLIARWDDLGPRIRPADDSRPLDEVQLLAPIPRPRRNVFCVGKNYREHAEEFGTSGYDASAGSTTEHLPTRPVVFTKPPSAVTGPDTEIDPHSDVTSELDYEAELAVVIGRAGRDIRPEDAHRHVWGYTIVDDVTARDRQRDHKQWFLGKALDTFCPMGPYIATADELDPEGRARPDLTVEARVNGEPRQKASTRDLVFDIPILVATLSAGLTLEPGDVIATGTPAGVGIGFDPPRFLRSGDLVEISITGLGTLRNRVR